VIDLDTGNRAAGSSDYQQRHFAEEFIRKASESDAPVTRARDADGHFASDDPETPEVNEAWEGGKPPTKKAAGSWSKKKAPAKKAVKKKAKKK
jgi:hypothetical protein